MRNLLPMFALIALSMGAVNTYAQRDTVDNEVKVATTETLDSAVANTDFASTDLDDVPATNSRLNADQNDNPMYSNGRIYVVIAVIAVVFIGLAGYLIHLDRKITKLENEK